MRCLILIDQHDIQKKSKLLYNVWLYFITITLPEVKSMYIILTIYQKTVLQNTSHGPFLSFRTITLIPFEPKLIDRSRLSPDQVCTSL